MAKQTVVGHGSLTPLLVPFTNVLQLHSQHRGLDRVHARVPAELGMEIALRASMVAQAAHLFGPCGLLRGQDSRIDVGAKIFGRVKTESGGTYERSHSPITPFCTNGLSGIFNKRYPEFIR